MRVNFRVLAATAALLSVAACADSGTEPRSSASGRVTASNRAPAFDYSTAGRSGTQTTDFVVTSQGGSFNVAGMFDVNFPANSICDPAQSTYGDTEWNKPCVLLKDNIQIHAAVRLTPTGVAVDFQPALRFSPSAQVTMSTDIFASVITSSATYLSQNPSALRPLAVLYEPSFGAAAVSDYRTDPDVATHVNLSTGRIWRRVKHFSGYLMGSGAPCDPSPDLPDCIAVDQFH